MAFVVGTSTLTRASVMRIGVGEGSLHATVLLFSYEIYQLLVGAVHLYTLRGFNLGIDADGVQLPNLERFDRH